MEAGGISPACYRFCGCRVAEYSRDDEGTTSGSRFRDGRGCNIWARPGAASSASSSPAKRRWPSPGRGGRSGTAWAAAIFGAACKRSLRRCLRVVGGRYSIFDLYLFVNTVVVSAR